MGKWLSKAIDAIATFITRLFVGGVSLWMILGIIFVFLFVIAMVVGFVWLLFYHLIYEPFHLDTRLQRVDKIAVQNMLDHDKALNSAKFQMKDATERINTILNTDHRKQRFLHE